MFKLYLFWNAMENIFGAPASWTTPNFTGVFNYLATLISNIKF